jgi:hypothetical protein
MAIGIIDLPWRDLSGYFAALSHKSRSNVGRQMRALFGAGDVQLLTATEPQAAAVLFELYRCIEPHSWKGQADVSISRSPQAIDLCAGLLDPAQSMRMVIQVLLLDGMPIAGLISGNFDQGFYAMHVVYDERHGELAPGSAIMLLGIRQALAGGCRFVNLLWGSGHYKTRWLAQMHETRSLQVYRIGSPYYWRRVLGDLRRRWFGDPADEGVLKFNPLRRALARRDAPAVAPAADAALVAGGACGHELSAVLIERARQIKVPCLSKTQLAAAMPFATSPTRATRATAVRTTPLQAA